MFTGLRRSLAQVVFACAVSFSAGAQSSIPEQTIPNRNLSTVYATNVLAKGILGGLGAVKNKQNFFKGFFQGSVAGAISTTGMYMAGQQEELVWPGKLTNSLGSSMLENTIADKKTFSRYAIIMGPTKLTFDNDQEKKFRVDVLPVTTALLLHSVFNRDRTFELQKSLQYATPIFSNKEYLQEDKAVTTLFGHVAATKDALNHSDLSLAILQTFQYRNASAVAEFVPNRIRAIEDGYPIQFTHDVSHGIVNNVGMMFISGSNYHKNPQYINLYNLSSLSQ